MKPWSSGSMARFPPFARALFTISSTSARLEQESANKPSVCKRVSQISRFVNVLKNGSLRSITDASSFTIMQAALSSVNCGLNWKPSFPKKSIDRLRSWTAKLTNIFRELFVCMFISRSVRLKELVQGAARRSFGRSVFVAGHHRVLERHEAVERGLLEWNLAEEQQHPSRADLLVAWERHDFGSQIASSSDGGAHARCEHLPA